MIGFPICMSASPYAQPAKDAESLVSYHDLTASIKALAAEFHAAKPFPHIVIENFLTREAAEGCLGEFPRIGSDQWINYTHVNERKYGRSDRRLFGTKISAVIDELNSPRFVRFLEKLTGIEQLVADADLMGGGLHQSERGGFLNVHADFTGHPHHPAWRRRVNLLIYLNRDWQPSYGGDLELWEKDMSLCVRKVAPIFNRAVIFLTDMDSFHGHPEPLTCPPEITRKSIALYYFTEEQAPFVVRSTEYRARPGDGLKAAWIYLDKMGLRLYDKMKRVLKLDDRFASNVLKMLTRNKRN